MYCFEFTAKTHSPIQEVIFQSKSDFKRYFFNISYIQKQIRLRFDMDNLINAH